VAVLSGEVSDLRRSFVAATRTWADCRIDDLDTAVEAQSGDMAVVRATYRFSGTTRRGSAVSYAAAATFVLQRMRPADGNGEPAWLITRFHESYREGGLPPGT
jgi:ketosteroid isomerase-like protein